MAMQSAERRVPEHIKPEWVYDFDIYEDNALRADLHVAYARLHQTAPEVFYTPAHGGHWVITKHAAITSVVMDPEHFSATEMQIPRVPNPPQFIPLNLDPPANLPYRQLLMPFFSPKAVGGMTEKIRQRAREVVGEVAAAGHCEFVSAVAARFPVSIFLELMGFPVERLEEFRGLAEMFFRARGDAAVHEAFNLTAAELVKMIAERRAAPLNDLLSHLVTAKIDGGRLLTMDELMKMCFLLFLGGLDTVTNASSFTARFLAGNPGLQDRLLRDPAAMEPFVEEAVRMFGVVNTPRLVVKDCERFGVTFRAGDMVLCNLPLAGWDQAKNPSPEVFDIDRKNRSYLIFSTGPHLCLGHFLARVEMRALFTEWVQQIGHFQLAEGYVPHYRPGLVMALERLDLTWSARKEPV